MSFLLITHSPVQACHALRAGFGVLLPFVPFNRARHLLQTAAQLGEQGRKSCLLRLLARSRHQEEGAGLVPCALDDVSSHRGVSTELGGDIDERR